MFLKHKSCRSSSRGLVIRSPHRRMISPNRVLIKKLKPNLLFKKSENRILPSEIREDRNQQQQRTPKQGSQPPPKSEVWAQEDLPPRTRLPRDTVENNGVLQLPHMCPLWLGTEGSHSGSHFSDTTECQQISDSGCKKKKSNAFISGLGDCSLEDIFERDQMTGGRN